MALLDDLKQAATPPTPAGFKPGVVFQGSTPVEVTTPPLPAMTEAGEFAQAVKDLGYPIPDGYTLELVEMQLVQHENFWTREATGDDAVTKPSSTFRYRFHVVKGSTVDREDLDALAEKARSEFFEVVDEPREPRSLVVALADFQTGKTDERGGTEELLARSESALARVVHKVIREKYDEVILLDVGDSTEGFESAPNADRTNDLSKTEQIRVWRRIFWRWIDQMARVAPKVTVVAVGSNHCRVRRGKNAVGDALDDWGIEVLAQVKDIAAANPEMYSHVEFIQPRQNTEHVILTTHGVSMAVMHGHQANNPNGLPDVLKKNARRGPGMADIAVVGHFHHLRVVNFGDEQTLLVCPSNDAGSSWFQYSGENSRAGILTFEIDENGWSGLDVIWTS